MNSIKLTGTQAQHLTSVIGSCAIGKFSGLFRELSKHFPNYSVINDDLSNKVYNYSNRLTANKYYAHFDYNTMTLQIDNGVLYHINEMMKLGGYDIIEDIDEDEKNPCGLIINFIKK